MLKLTFALNLNQYRNSSVLLLFGHIREVVLGVNQFFGAECDVNIQSASLCIELSKRSSANIEGLEAPTDAALNTLVREQEILDSIVIVLNAALRLRKTREIATTITGYELNLTAALLFKHFCITLCLCNSVDVIKRHRTKSSKGSIFVILGVVCFSSCNRSNLFNSGFFHNRFFCNNFFNHRFFNHNFLNNGFFCNRFFYNFGCNLFFFFNQGDCIGCICRFVEVFSHSFCNSLKNFVRYISSICFCINLLCQIKCHLVNHIVESTICIAEVDFSNFCVENIHSFCNSIRSINIIFCFFGNNFLCQGVCQTFDAFFNNCIGIFDEIGNDNRLDFGNVTNGFNCDNGISTAVFDLNEFHTDKDREYNENQESNQNEDSNTDCRAKERNLVVGSQHQGDFACRSVAFNNVVSAILAQAYSICTICSGLSAFGCVVEIEVINGNALEILVCYKVSRYGEINSELLTCLSTCNKESVALVFLYTAKSLASKLGGNGKSRIYSIGNTIFAYDND